MSETDLTELPFEDVVGRLEAVIERLESGGLSLEEMLEAYGQGVALGARAQELLDQAQLRIEQLQSAADEQAG